MRTHYEAALAMWLGIGDEREIANAYYNASFIYAIGPDGDVGAAAIPKAIGRGYMRAGPRGFHRKSATSGARPTPCGALGNY